MSRQHTDTAIINCTITLNYQQLLGDKSLTENKTMSEFLFHRLANTRLETLGHDDDQQMTTQPAQHGLSVV